MTIETSYASGEGWAIRVTDNGFGVSEEDRERIFSLFESSKGARGTGLGLPVSDKILREHGGRIEIEDADPPPGACFVLRLPDIEKNAAVSANSQTVALEPRDGSQDPENSSLP